jgi:P-type Cu+ transporter
LTESFGRGDAPGLMSTPGVPSRASTDPAEPNPSAACPGCGQPVDPLRAGHVAITDGGFRYYCTAQCKRLHFETRGAGLRQEDVETAEPPRVAAVTLPAPKANGASIHAPAPEEAPVTERIHAAAEPAVPSVPSSVREEPPTAPGVRTRRESPTVDRREVIRWLRWLGIAAGVLAPAVALLGASAEGARGPLALAAMLALLVSEALTKRDPSDVHPLVTVAPPLVGAVAAVLARAAHDARADRLTVFVGLAAASALASSALAARMKAGIQASRDRVTRALDVAVRVVRGDQTVSLHASEVKPGEQVVVDTGEVLGVDAIVAAGEAVVVPWLDARVECTKREGDALVAGARVVSGKLRVTTTWAGFERGWSKLTTSPARADVAAPIARSSRAAIERGAVAAAALAAVATFASNATAFEVVAAACAASLAFGLRAVAAAVAVHLARAQLFALEHGIVYRDARAFERAAAADLAVLCARGTLLMGEPEIVAIEPLASLGNDRVLALAAGAETVSSHPFASAVLRAARTRGVRPDNVRNPTIHSGLGITAIASNGEGLVVGSRGLMLEERVSVALADARVTELEAQGRSVLLVALAGKVVGLIAMQDGLRAGARAAVQRLVDAKIEPVLLSGEARETCETIGRALDIDHIRPEVLPTDRGAEVRALGEGGHTSAVLGHPATDDGALGAADVAVAMGAAGSTPGEWAIAMASDDVREAVLALTIARSAQGRVRGSLLIGLAPGVLTVLALAFGVLPPVVVPIVAFVASAAVLTHTRD